MSDVLDKKNAEEMILLEKLKFEEKAMIIRKSVESIKEAELHLIKDLLFESELINFEEMEELEKKEITKWPHLILDSENEKKYDKYIEAIINKEEIKTLLKKLASKEDQPKSKELETQLKSTSNNNPAVVDWFDQDYSDLKNVALTQADASRFSTCFGAHWKDIIIELGINNNIIELELQSVGNSPQRAISNLIIKWIQKNGKYATFRKFMDALKNVQDSHHDTIEWEQVKKVLERRRSN
ncbi:hypothetical protein Btru_062812 [Bulinus truncatus]|nr:hypothetical protein Btru_062812 [Bulinus truncatus]